MKLPKSCYKETSKYIGLAELDESVVYFEKRGDYLIAGTGCNTGIIPQYKHKMDDCFSLDENLQVFIETILEDNK